MISVIVDLMGILPPLKERKDPTLACVIGLLVGGIGLGLYFRSFVDLVLVVAIAFATVFVFGDIGIFGGMLIAGLYGFFRAHNSNQR